MTSELTVLSWTLILALVQIVLPSWLRNQETGVAYNTGPRDMDGPPMRPITGRLKRAQQNLFETLPIFATAVLIAHVAGRNGGLTHAGVWLYFVARLVYLPLYAAGVPYLRSLTWLVSAGGLVMVLVALLQPA